MHGGFYFTIQKNILLFKGNNIISHVYSIFISSSYYRAKTIATKLGEKILQKCTSHLHRFPLIIVFIFPPFQNIRLTATPSKYMSLS